MLHQPSGGVRDTDLLAQLQRGNPFLVLAHAVDRPEPAAEGSSGLVKNSARSDRTLIPAPSAFMDPPTGHVAVRPALRRQVLSTLELVAETGAEFTHRHDRFSFQSIRLFHERHHIAFCSPDQA